MILKCYNLIYNSYFKISGGNNKFVNVSYDQDFTTVNCTFLTWPQVTSEDTTDYDRAEANYCTCSITYGINKSQVVTGTTMNSSIVVLQLADAIHMQEHSNFTITARCDNHTICINGTFTRYIYGIYNYVYTWNVIATVI